MYTGVNVFHFPSKPYTLGRKKLEIFVKENCDKRFLKIFFEKIIVVTYTSNIVY